MVPKRFDCFAKAHEFRQFVIPYIAKIFYLLRFSFSLLKIIADHHLLILYLKIFLLAKIYLLLLSQYL